MLNRYLQNATSAAPLSVFRIAFGLLIFASIIRFWINGWIEDLYIKPAYFFSFYGFEFVKPLGEYTYIIFLVCALASLMVAVGLFYRIATIVLFASFTFIELMDKSTYLNHYYFVSLICFLLILLPAHAYFSLDAKRDKSLNASMIPSWCIDVIKIFICLIYIFAGLAKINSDWLIEAMPLRIWLPAKNDLPLIGQLFNHVWVAYAFSWMGCLYDLSISFLLLKKSTRPYAFIAVITFHLLTAILFPIGMFPYIMITSALIFFSPDVHQKIIATISRIIGSAKDLQQVQRTYAFKRATLNIVIPILILFFLVQMALPFRYLAYPGELFWTEQGYRFSWRVMLVEKAGYAQFTVKDRAGRQTVVDNSVFLTPLQEKMMATQPDMILQYAHMLSDHYIKEGFVEPEVYVDSYVALNGRLGRPLVDPNTNLARQKDSFSHKPWILIYNDEISGL